jgi:hypothetical protein
LVVTFCSNNRKAQDVQEREHESRIHR